MTGQGRDVTLQKLSADWTREILLSAVVSGTCFADLDTVKDYIRRSIRRRNPPCNVEDNLRAGHIITEAWFRGY